MKLKEIDLLEVALAVIIVMVIGLLVSIPFCD